MALTAQDYLNYRNQVDPGSLAYGQLTALAQNPNDPNLAPAAQSIITQINPNDPNGLSPQVQQQLRSATLGTWNAPSGTVANPKLAGPQFVTMGGGNTGYPQQTYQINPDGSRVPVSSTSIGAPDPTPVRGGVQPLDPPGSFPTRTPGSMTPIGGGAQQGTDINNPFQGTGTLRGFGPIPSNGPNWNPIGGGGHPQPLDPSGRTPLGRGLPQRQYPGAVGSNFQYQPISTNNPAIQTQYPGASYPSGQPAGFNIPQGAVAAGPNGAFQNWSTWDGGQPYTGTDPAKMAGSEANRAVDIGNNFENQYANEYLQALGQQNQYQAQSDSAYNDLAKTPGYTAQEAQGIQGDPYSVQGVVGQTAQSMNAAIDPSKLGVSDQYVQQLKDQAAGEIGAQYGAAEDQLQRQAEASGNVNPLALSAARNRLLQSQSVDRANALTGTDIQATGAQRQANTGIANMRLGAATTLGGMGLQAGQYADTAASNRAANIGQQRIQGQQAARNYWQSQGQFQGGQANQATQARLAGAQTSLSGMGQGGQIAANTEAARNAAKAKLGINLGGISVGNVGI